MIFLLFWKTWQNKLSAGRSRLEYDFFENICQEISISNNRWKWGCRNLLCGVGFMSYFWRPIILINNLNLWDPVHLHAYPRRAACVFETHACSGTRWHQHTPAFRYTVTPAHSRPHPRTLDLPVITITGQNPGWWSTRAWCGCGGGSSRLQAVI